MRLLFLFFLFFSAINCYVDTSDIALNLIKNQLTRLARAVKAKDYKTIETLYFIPDVFPPDEALYKSIIDLFTGAHFVPKSGYFLQSDETSNQKSALDGWLDRVTDNGEKEMYYIVMKRHPWSPTDWKIYKLHTYLPK